jgi:hypothetical protein
MFWIVALAALAVVLVLARLFDRRRGRSGQLELDHDPASRTARDEHVRHRLENPSGEHGPRP